MRFLKIALAFLAGLVVTYAATVAAMFAYMSANNVFDRDGGMSMAIMFAIGPLAGLIGGIVAAAVAVIRLRRPAAPSPPKVHRWPPKTRAVIAAVVALVAGYAVAAVPLWLFVYGKMSFRTYEAALMVSLLPYAVGAIAAAFAALRVLRSARR